MDRRGVERERLIALSDAALTVSTSWIVHPAGQLVAFGSIVATGTAVTLVRAISRPTASRLILGVAALALPLAIAASAANGTLDQLSVPLAPWHSERNTVRLPIELAVGLFIGSALSAVSGYLDAMRVLPRGVRVRATLDTLMTAALVISIGWQFLDLADGATDNLVAFAPGLCALVMAVGFYSITALNSIDGRRDKLVAWSLASYVIITTVWLVWPMTAIVRLLAPITLSISLLGHTIGLATPAVHEPRPYPRATRKRWRHRMKSWLIAGFGVTALLAMHDGDFALHNALLSYVTLILFFLAERSAENESAKLHDELENRLADLEERKDRLRILAETDELTGLRNRRSFLHELDQRLPGLDTSVVAFIDLDGFKDVNDSLGHDAGDELLIAAGVRLVEAAGPEATVARLGGDELAVFFPSCPAGSAVDACHRLLVALRRPTGDSIDAPSVTASIGVACASTHSTTSRVLAEADMAMYDAKAAGGNRVVAFDERLRAERDAQSAAAVQLGRAVERAQIVAHFQPVVALGDESVHGFEALMRWRHPERGVLTPDTFLHVADDADLVRQLGREVLESACVALARWRQLGLVPAHATVSVNLAAHQLHDPAMCDIVQAALDGAGVAPDNLVLALTESSRLGDDGTAMRNVERLATTGTGLSIDDLGTGRSSLAHLKQLPVRELKVDRSFVAGLPHDRGDVAIVTAVVGLAAGLGCASVAAGVDHEAQAAALRSIGCHFAHGHLFAKPMPAAEVERWLSGRQVPSQCRTKTGVAGVDREASNR